MGMDERKGKLLKGEVFLKQAVQRAVRTRKGSRPMARWYGVSSMKYLGQPINAGSVLGLTADLADSIEGTIPGVKLRTVIDQENGESLRISLELDTENIILDV